MLNYITVKKNNFEHYKILERLMLEYISETDLHQNISTTKETILKITKSMIDKLDEDRILQIVLTEDDAVGFCYAKIDRRGDKGEICPGWGYIMEFFVREAYRRKGIGRKLVSLCEQFFINRGVENVWLTADAVTGIPFWLACNYFDTKKISAENNQKILIKTLKQI